ncbi:hypothetical protein Tco_0323497 [Tanacetum coccineum]
MYTSATHNAIMEVGGKDRALMLVAGSYKRVYAEAEAVHIIITGISNDIYSIMDACANAKEMWITIEHLMQEWQRFVTIVNQGKNLKKVSYHTLFDILKQHQDEVNELRAKILARNANSLALAPIRIKGKEIDTAPSLPLELETKDVNNEEDTLRDKEIDKLVALI